METTYSVAWCSSSSLCLGQTENWSVVILAIKLLGLGNEGMMFSCLHFPCVQFDAGTHDCFFVCLSVSRPPSDLSCTGSRIDSFSALGVVHNVMSAVFVLYTSYA